LAKPCKFHPERRCFHESCGYVDGSGLVVVCPLKPNPDGFFVARKVKPAHSSIFDVWVSSRKR